MPFLTSHFTFADVRWSLPVLDFKSSIHSEAEWISQSLP